MPLSKKDIRTLSRHKEPMTFDHLYSKMGYVYLGNLGDNPHYFAEFGIEIADEDLAYFTFTSVATNIINEGIVFSDFKQGRYRFMCEFSQEGIDKLLQEYKGTVVHKIS